MHLWALFEKPLGLKMSVTGVRQSFCHVNRTLVLSGLFIEQCLGEDPIFRTVEPKWNNNRPIALISFVKKFANGMYKTKFYPRGKVCPACKCPGRTPLITIY